MKRYFVSYAFSTPNGGHGFGNAFIVMDGSIRSDQDVRNAEKATLAAQGDPRMKGASLSLINFQEVGHE